MNIQQKLAELTKFSNRSLIGRTAGLSPGALSAIIASKESKPLAETVLRLARVLNVDPGWLLNDEESWPPRRVEKREIGTPIIVDRSKLDPKSQRLAEKMDAEANVGADGVRVA